MDPPLLAQELPGRLTRMTLDLYTTVVERLPATPGERFHYVFNLRARAPIRPQSPRMWARGGIMGTATGHDSASQGAAGRDRRREGRGGGVQGP